MCLDNKTIKLVFDKKIDNLNYIKKRLYSKLSPILKNKQRIFDIIFIINELYTNFLKHAKNQKNEHFYLEIKINSNIYLEVIYKDLNFENIKIKKPDLNSLPSNGYGLFMIKQMSKHLYITYNTIKKTLTFKITL